jgi:hypothetical protein
LDIRKKLADGHGVSRMVLQADRLPKLPKIRLANIGGVVSFPAPLAHRRQ